MVEKTVVRRCAIYVRKSSEEGLDMSYNSLEAQTDACSAYITSQRHEGWIRLPTTYEDGGYSGGNMERPGLKQLLADVDKGLIDIIVVYKIDRLTRSLTDFSKLNDILDRRQVSFVAVTQQFNTSTSMGRLTLNVLLSFAQFEREVSWERIRDKVAASKKKGMWMGGPVPLGYQVQQRKLLIVPSEAETVRHLFARYLELRSIHGLQREIQQQGVRSRIRTRKNGQTVGGVVLGPGAIRHMLKNPLYTGIVMFKGEHYEGEHEAIVDQELFDAVQLILRQQGPGERANSKRKTGSLLRGIAYDDSGQRLQPNYSIKKGVRYHYYTSAKRLRNTHHDGTGLRIPAGDLERLVSGAVIDRLQDQSKMHDWIKASLLPGDISTRHASISKLVNELRNNIDSADERLRSILHNVSVTKASLTVQISASGLARALGVGPEELALPSHPGADPEGVTDDRSTSGESVERMDDPRNRKDPLLISLNSHLLRCGKQVKLILSTDTADGPEPNARLVMMVAKAKDWFDGLKSGRYPSIKHIAIEEKYDKSYVGRLISVAFLAPDIVERILTGNHSATLPPERLRKSCPLPARWADQRAMLLN